MDFAFYIVWAYTTLTEYIYGSVVHPPAEYRRHIRSFAILAGFLIKF